METYAENYNNPEYLNLTPPWSDEEQVINVGNFERGVSIALGTILLYSGLKKIFRKPMKGISQSSIGGYLLYRGITGNCALYSRFDVDGTKTTSVNIRNTFIVNKPRSEVYAFWRKMENLPLFMDHLASVTEIDNRRSHWEAKFPENNPISVKWDAEIVKDEIDRLISWQSLPGSTIENAGKVEFRDALGNMGTELRIMITYRPPAGNIGAGIAKLFNPLFEKVVREDVVNFKQYIEQKPSATVNEQYSPGLT